MRSPTVEIITDIYIKLNNLINKTSLDVTTYMRVFPSHYEAGNIALFSYICENINDIIFSLDHQRLLTIGGGGGGGGGFGSKDCKRRPKTK
jgi:hypothetical protein